MRFYSMNALILLPVCSLKSWERYLPLKWNAAAMLLTARDGSA